MYPLKTLVSLVGVALVFGSCLNDAPEGVSPLTYPSSRRVDHVDTYHGVAVPDPYRWLEEMESEEVLQWTRRQDSLARSFIQQRPEYEPLKRRMDELNAYPDIGDFVKRGDYFFYMETDPEKPQSVLYAEAATTGERTILVDPNALSTTGAVAIADYSPSPSGKLLAYALVDGPSRYFDWHFINVEDGTALPETLQAAYLPTGSAAVRNPWTSDEQGFYYKGFAHIDRDDQTVAPRQLRLYSHRLGQPQATDRVVYERPDEEAIRFDGMVDDEGRHLIIREYSGREDGDAIYYKALDRPTASALPLITGMDASFVFLGNAGSKWWFLTDYAAPKRRIIEVDVNQPEPAAWKEVVAELDATLDQAFVFGGRFLLAYLKDAKTVVHIHEATGARVHEVAIPMGLIWNMHMRYWSGFTGDRHDPIAYVRNLGITSAGSIYSLDMRTGALEMQKRSGTPLPIERYVTEQVFYQSKDGTRVPMFITRRKDLTRDGTTPTMIWAYGAYGFTAQPYLNSKYGAFLELGGILAMPNIRGGGAYGRDWAEAGARAQKENTIDDILAAATWLIDNKYTSSSKLVLDGNSAGATVVGGALVKAPDLFGAVILEVPITDMLRAIHFKGGAGWVSTFGTPEIEEEFRVLHAYSPYHNVDSDTCYPPVFIAAGDQDVTAVPMHAYKLTAALQHARQTCRAANPVLLRIDWGTDHGANKPEPNRQAERVAELTFLSEVLDIDLMP